jgi:hypothetical protein
LRNAIARTQARAGRTALMRLGGSKRQAVGWRALPFAPKNSSEVSRPRDPDVTPPEFLAALTTARALDA